MCFEMASSGKGLVNGSDVDTVNCPLSLQAPQSLPSFGAQPVRSGRFEEVVKLLLHFERDSTAIRSLQLVP